MDPLVNIYPTIPVSYPFLADPTRLTRVAADHKAVEWLLYKYFREDGTAEADTALMQGLLAWWALQRLGKVAELMGMQWDAPRQISQAEFEASTIKEQTVSALQGYASGLCSIGDLVARQYNLNTFNLDILDRYIKGPSKVPDPTLLQIALDKLPTQRDLEFNVPTFRVVDAKGVGPIVAQCRTGRPFPLNGGGPRSDKFTSTSVGYNSFAPSMGVDGCILFVRGISGRYIGCFGDYGAVDGAEILYDPATMVIAKGWKTVPLTKPKIAQLSIILLEETQERAPKDSRKRRAAFKKLGY